VSKDRSEVVLFAFRTHIGRIVDLPPVYLRGLDPTARYTIDGAGGERSGASLMHAGVQIALSNFESAVRRLRRVG
jgi:alpha-galactosidase